MAQFAPACIAAPVRMAGAAGAAGLGVGAAAAMGGATGRVIAGAVLVGAGVGGVGAWAGGGVLGGGEGRVGVGGAASVNSTASTVFSVSRTTWRAKPDEMAHNSSK